MAVEQSILHIGLLLGAAIAGGLLARHMRQPAAIGMLIHGLATTKNSGKEYRIAGLTQNVMDVLKKVKIDKVLNIYNNVNTAKI